MIEFIARMRDVFDCSNVSRFFVLPNKSSRPRRKQLYGSMLVVPVWSAARFRPG